ncbi:unnamed protein product [Ilex paraguariensis]|uniref:Uncharacterized protein n=1 Tax=Ilex paraguariensis TaxID=185542 RepID=A0ABC8TDW8_9AQUA
MNGVKAAQQFCSSYFLSNSVMYMIRDMRIQFGTLLADIGLINLPTGHQAILCAGLYPSVAATEEGIGGTVLASLKQKAGFTAKGRPVWYDGRREVHIHPSSINCSLKAFQYPFLVFLEKVETNKVFLRDTTIVSPYSILLFGGTINIQHQTGLVTIDGWLKMAAPAQTAVLFKELRLTLHSILEELIRKPHKKTTPPSDMFWRHEIISFPSENGCTKHKK